ncbi:predicted protein [Pyrenophora tritici-repentis Pt-1C-BFP]|uniref:Uncharacterized protein n=1 Tax=Pyrenophora tritici-repentis (strain Pt-1C-BFP) TaxID=426418 RepID=B2W2M1_PYRTR|nr:uncharacterized protein PTRG_03669 [Pyrenophora tritici-repentis Pt-1C-BFP]EDU46507.1 predicted protein [Pyrenophora tritici-repentis Pt-1C-BFP]
MYTQSEFLATQVIPVTPPADNTNCVICYEEYNTTSHEPVTYAGEDSCGHIFCLFVIPEAPYSDNSDEYGEEDEPWNEEAYLTEIEEMVTIQERMRRYEEITILENRIEIEEMMITQRHLRRIDEQEEAIAVFYPERVQNILRSIFYTGEDTHIRDADDTGAVICSEGSASSNIG